MMHQQISIHTFISKASVGSTRNALARLKTTDGNGSKQSLADFLETTWKAVLSKAKTDTKTDLVATASEYGTTQQMKETKAEMIGKLKTSFFDYLSELLKAQKVDEGNADRPSYFSSLEGEQNVGEEKIESRKLTHATPTTPRNQTTPTTPLNSIRVPILSLK